MYLPFPVDSPAKAAPAPTTASAAVQTPTATRDLILIDPFPSIPQCAEKTAWTPTLTTTQRRVVDPNRSRRRSLQPGQPSTTRPSIGPRILRVRLDRCGRRTRRWVNAKPCE